MFPRICAYSLSPSRWNSLTAATQPTDTATFPPLVPSESRASEGGGRERTPGGAGATLGHHQASTDPGRVTCGESAPSPGLSALHADRTPRPPWQPLPARPARTELGAWLPSVPAGPQRLELVTTGGGYRAGQPVAGGSQSGRGRADRPRRAGIARSYLTPSVSSVSSSTAAAPAVAAAATFLGSAPAAAASSSSTLCSPLPRRAHQAPRPFSHLPPPSPTHTRPETLCLTAPAVG